MVKRFESEKLHQLVHQKYPYKESQGYVGNLHNAKNTRVSEADIAMYLMKELKIGVYPRPNPEDCWQATDYERWICGETPEQAVFECAAKILEDRFMFIVYDERSILGDTDDSIVLTTKDTRKDT